MVHDLSTAEIDKNPMNFGVLSWRKPMQSTSVSPCDKAIDFSIAPSKDLAEHGHQASVLSNDIIL